jgi:hypothetical protein
MNYAHLVYGMQMTAALGLGCIDIPKKIERINILSRVNGFLNQAEGDMRNRGVQAMLCPCIYCLN